GVKTNATTKTRKHEEEKTFLRDFVTSWLHLSLRLGRFVPFFPLHQPRDRDHLVFALYVDQRDALCRPSDRPDVVGFHADDHALLCDQQDLVSGLHVGDADDEAVSRRRRDVDDPDAPARLDTVLVDFRSLAE